MPNAEWILTFDDGPLPSDVVSAEQLSDDDLLGPLRAILKTLKEHPDGPIPAVFYLRGPAYPWSTPPSQSLIERKLPAALIPYDPETDRAFLLNRTSSVRANGCRDHGTTHRGMPEPCHRPCPMRWRHPQARIRAPPDRHLSSRAGSPR